MKHEHWLRFTWDLIALGPLDDGLPEHYEIASVTPADEKDLRKVISSSFTLDPAWNAAIHEVTQLIDPWLERTFASETAIPLALRHGSRIIGASIVTADSGTDNQLAPGPCILLEYRNRGFGTHLLARSLAALRDAGLHQASTIAKESSPVAKFLYTKFHGVSTPHDFTPLLAA
ncbi:MAG: GNAT family N-acetyltransferase [Chthoniobacterales bacterium]